MHQLSFLVWGVVLPAVCSTASTVPNIQRREICVHDLLLESFEFLALGSNQFCSSILGINDQTITLPTTTLYT